jgi:hypothetical protein
VRGYQSCFVAIQLTKRSAREFSLNGKTFFWIRSNEHLQDMIVRSSSLLLRSTDFPTVLVPQT